VLAGWVPFRANWRTSCDDIIDGKHMLSKTICCVWGDGSGGGGGDGGWRRAALACGVRRAVCDISVRWRRASTACGGTCGGGMRRRAADRGNRFATMEQEGVRRQLMF
jgi:hypothetical protein